MVRFEDVTLRYGQGPEILTGLSLHLEPGSFHCLVGPSGAGKSSLLKLLYLGQKPSAGRISLFGRDVSRLSRDGRARLRRQIGVVFQEFRLINHLSVFDNVALPLRLAGERESSLRTKVEELLAWVGLADHLKAAPETLSGGQQQRVAIARALVGRPNLLVADEPTGSVDDRIGQRLMHLFQELHRNGTTIVLATHNLAMVERLGHPVLRLEEGRIPRHLPHDHLPEERDSLEPVPRAPRGH
ncbi:cell division ATP-binding protein FtsE [Aquibaculum sediminis]|uniref:cell division ATP-binding protein FtsE n=1 Tax=Aquibaculum sediminis TaxID=3231907 RepID=UPI003455AB4C